MNVNDIPALNHRRLRPVNNGDPTPNAFLSGAPLPGYPFAKRL
jgi:hypothetical protein